MDSNNSKLNRIEELEKELYIARRVIVNFLSENIKNVYFKHYYINSWDEMFEWKNNLIDKIIKNANILEKTSIYDYNDRALCPICNSDTTTFNVKGFVVPEGLKIHLLGRGGKNQCPVFLQIFKLAESDYVPRIKENESKMY